MAPGRSRATASARWPVASASRQPRCVTGNAVTASGRAAAAQGATGGIGPPISRGSSTCAGSFSTGSRRVRPPGRPWLPNQRWPRSRRRSHPGPNRTWRRGARAGGRCRCQASCRRRAAWPGPPWRSTVRRSPDCLIVRWTPAAARAARVGRIAEPLNARTVLLACADDEEHSLPLYALAAALAERDVRTTMLGARTPPPALADAISRIGPAAAFVWSQTAATGDPAKLEGLARQRPPLRLFTAGPGWRGTAPRGRAVGRLSQAVQQASEAVGLA